MTQNCQHFDSKCYKNVPAWMDRCVSTCLFVWLKENGRTGERGTRVMKWKIKTTWDSGHDECLFFLWSWKWSVWLWFVLNDRLCCSACSIWFNVPFISLSGLVYWSCLKIHWKRQGQRPNKARRNVSMKSTLKVCSNLCFSLISSDDVWTSSQVSVKTSPGLLLHVNST